MPGTRLQYVYTSRDEVQRLLSERGVQLRLDDLAPLQQDEYIIELCEDASDIINEWCEVFYDYSDLYNSRWVRIRATWIAAYLLSQRRGNPAQLTQRYQDILQELEYIRWGVNDIPGLPKRGNFFPAMANLTVDPTFLLRSLRVVEQNSTNSPYARRESALIWSLDWL